MRMYGVQPAGKSRPLQIGEQCCTHTIAAPRHSHHGHCAWVEKGPNTLGSSNALALGTSGPHLRCVSRWEGNMEHAGVERALHRETARLKDLQHTIILTQYIGLKGVNSLSPSNGG